MEPYTWPKLISPRSIRLLKLESTAYGQELHGQLFTTLISSAPSYEAVSYRWDVKQACYDLTTPEGTIPVSSSVHEALTDLRHRDHCRILWIDSVCVDQANEFEKAEQVSLMKDIFAQAQKVVIYLGPQTPYTLLGLSLLDKILRTRPAVSVNDVKSWTEKDRVGRGLPALNDISWAALLSIADYSWFRRIWTAQEYIISREAEFTIGHISIGPDFLLKGLTIAADMGMLLEGNSISYRDDVTLIENDAFPVIPPTTERLLRMHNYTRTMFELREKYQHGTQKTLFDLLHFNRHREATEARDKLFVLRNLALDGDHPSLFPDYGCSQTEIFVRYAAYLILHHPTLALLCEAGVINHKNLGTYSRMNSLPSWVPDWSADVLLASFLPPDPVCVEVVSQKQVYTQGRLLHVKARLIDKIISVSEDRSPPELNGEDDIFPQSSKILSFQSTVDHPSVPHVGHMPWMSWWHTERGNTVVGAEGLRPGDFVALLYGDENLAALRLDPENEGTHHLVGTCAFGNRRHREDYFQGQETVVVLA